MKAGASRWASTRRKELRDSQYGQDGVKLIPDGFEGTHRGEAPSISQIEQLKKEFGVDAALYGEIPWYGKTRLSYPITGEFLDITAESLIIGCDRMEYAVDIREYRL